MIKQSLVASAIIFLCFIFFLNATALEEITTIFSPSPTYTITLSAESTLRYAGMASNSGVLFVSAGKDGLLIIDPANYTTYTHITDLGTINAISIFNDGRTIFFRRNGYLSRFQVNTSSSTKQKSLTLISQDKSSAGQNVNRLLFFENEKYAAAISDTRLIIFDLSSTTDFKQVGSFDIEIYGYRIARIKENLIFVINESVIVIHMDKITTNASEVTFQLTKIVDAFADYRYSDLAITNDNQYAYIADIWGGLNLVKFTDLSFSTIDANVTPTITYQFKNWWPTQEAPMLNKVILSSNNKFAIVGATSMGIYIFDISKQSSTSYPTLFQFIRVSGFSFQLIFSPTEDYLYYLNGLQFLVFELIAPNLNEQVPNIFNAQQANFTEVGYNTYQWRCYITENDKYLLGAFDKIGLYIYKLEGKPLDLELILNIPQPDYYFIDAVIFDTKQGYLVTSGHVTGVLLEIYLIEDIVLNPSTFSPVYQLTSLESIDYSIEGIRYSFDDSLIGISAYTQFFLIDASQGLHRLQVYGSIRRDNVIDCIFSKDNAYVLLIERTYGLISVNIQNKTSIFIEQVLDTFGGYSIISSLDGTLAFVGEGPKGIGIVDLMQLPKIVFISRLALSGSIFHITPLFQDQFLLVTSQVQGFISLVDIRDRLDLKLLAKFNVNNQNGLSSCISTHQDYSFLTNLKGITSLPLVSSARVHAEIFLVLGSETMSIKYLRLSLEQETPTFKISEKYQMQFYLIYPSMGMRLVNVYYYFQFEKISLPYWITFNQQLSTLDIEVVKDGLGENPMIPNLNIVLLELKTPLSVSSFVSTSLQLGQKESLVIIQELHVIGYLDFEYYLISSKFERQETIQFPSSSPASIYNSNTDVLQFIKKQLQASTTFNQILFNIEASLAFTIVAANAREDVFIESIQSSIQLYIEASIEMGKFVEIYYDGVIAQISNYATHLKLEGPVSNINNIMSNRILFFPLIKDHDEIIFHIIIKDGVNYVIEKDVTLTEASSFIVLKQKTYLQVNMKLQKQFNNIFSKGQVYIQENLSFEFSKDTFINPDTLSLSYTAYFCIDQNDGEFTETLDGAWMQQSSNSLRFFGLIPLERYRQTLRIRIKAFDGYTYATDEFVIEMNGIPFVYILGLFIKVFGPIITVLGLYRYRSIFFNFTFQNKNQYSREILQSGIPYYKKISLLSDENLKALLLFNQLLSKLPSLNISTNLSQKSQDSSIKDGFIRYSNLTVKEQAGQDYKPYYSPSQKNQDYANLKEILLKIERNAADLSQNRRKQDSLISAVQFQDEEASKMASLFLFESGDINMKAVVDSMISLKLRISVRTTQFSIENFTSELYCTHSQMHMALSAIVSRYFLRKHPLLQSIYIFLKEVGRQDQMKQAKTSIDWYNQYIAFTDSKLNANNSEQQTFPSLPTCELKGNAIEIRIKRLISTIQVICKETGEYLNWILPNLPVQIMFDVVKADALGLLNQVPSLFNKSQGEAIHLSFFNISSVQAFKHVNNLYCALLRRFFEMDYMNYGSQKNQQLPSWMEFKLKPSSIILSGTPTLQDIEAFVIRIFDDTGFILRQFEIEVRKNKGLLTKTNTTQQVEDLEQQTNQGIELLPIDKPLMKKLHSEDDSSSCLESSNIINNESSVKQTDLSLPVMSFPMLNQNRKSLTYHMYSPTIIKKQFRDAILNHDQMNNNDSSPQTEENLFAQKNGQAREEQKVAINQDSGERSVLKQEH